MIVCRVIGQAVATVKTESLRAVSLMLVRPADTAGADAGEPFVAVDTVGAGDGELVLVAQGSAAREAIRVAGPDRRGHRGDPRLAHGRRQAHLHALGRPSP